MYTPEESASIETAPLTTLQDYREAHTGSLEAMKTIRTSLNVIKYVGGLCTVSNGVLAVMHNYDAYDMRNTAISMASAIVAYVGKRHMDGLILHQEYDLSVPVREIDRRLGKDTELQQ